MLKTRFIGALLVSVVLIGGALWSRFFKTEPYVAEVALIERPSSELTTDEAFLSDFLATSTASTTPAKLSKSETLSRQLLSDLITLSSQGKASTENINALANEYAGAILKEKVASKQVSLNQILVVAETEESLTAYGKAVQTILLKYKNIAAAQYGGGAAGIASGGLSSLMGGMAKLYQAAANEFLLLKVPSSLANNHVSLVNNYLSSAAALELIADPDTDPMLSYAALNTHAANTAEENKFILNIQRVLMANGIIFDNKI